jgi:uncharacterized membrane protein YidH (DUF202 family)
MTQQQELFTEKVSHLAEKRTEMAHERTILAYIRTAATIILFGIAFIGSSKTWGNFFFYLGWIAIGIGLLILIMVIFRTLKHSREIKTIKDFFSGLINFRFKRK